MLQATCYSQRLPAIAARPQHISHSVPLPAVAAPKRKRASAAKSRAGCITCKARHMKCDEGRPTCARCDKSMVQCGGYHVAKAAPKVVPRTRALLPRPLLSQSNPAHATFSNADVVYFDLFRHRLVPDLAGYCSRDFWNRIILCESIEDPCVRESVLAIGALSQAIFYSTDTHRPETSPYTPIPGPLTGNNHHKSAISHYVRAVSMFRRRLVPATKTHSPRSILIMTILLITFELLRNNTKSADCLMKSGINLLKDSLEFYRDPALEEAPSHGKANSRGLVEDDVEDIGYMLPFLSIMSGYTPSFRSQQQMMEVWDPTLTTALPEPTHMNMDKLQTRWGKLFTLCTAFIGKSLLNNMQNKNFDASESERQQQSLLWQLSQWKDILDFYDVGSVDMDHDTKKSFQMMRIHHVLLFTTVSCCLDRTELAWDEFDAEFLETVELCLDFLKDMKSTARATFTLNPGLIPPLGNTLVKCRNHNIRMLAAEALKQISWREGAWDVGTMLIGKLGAALLEERSRDRETGMIPPENRWFWTANEWDEGRQKLVGHYIRLMLDENGEMVQTTLLLDIDRWPDICGVAQCTVNHNLECRRLAVGTKNK
ncbi:hypothetical protein FDECE_214 [Fusarium decemcellulare]|nr:hypothetical protein FDECE_214 [Fusarium decemcellulare]